MKDYRTHPCRPGEAAGSEGLQQDHDPDDEEHVHHAAILGRRAGGTDNLTCPDPV